MPKITLSAENLEKINNAVKKAERKTTGEIAVALIRESSDYASQELMFGIAGGLIYFFITIFFYHRIENIIQGMFWGYTPVYMSVFTGLSTFLVILICYWLANIPFIDRLIVSDAVKRRKVHERAVRHFLESGITATRDRTGVLIFISLLEKRVELLADRGISKKISQEQWNGVVNHILEGVRRKKIADHLVEAITSTGDMLAVHFPSSPDDRNELSDDMAVLEK